MPGIDWRKLYAANQAIIARAGLPAGYDAHAPSPLPVWPGLRAAATRPAHTFASQRDGGHALVHVPRGLDPTSPAPLVCMLHACTQDPATFAAASLMSDAADRHGFVVVYPGQSRRENPHGCWNWFLREHQRRGAGEPAAIARIVRGLIATNSRCAIDPERVFVAGFSSGGAMAAILAACYPDLFAAVAVHSGLAYGSAKDVLSAFKVMARGGGNATAQGHAAHSAMGERSRPVPSIVIHGSADRTVAPANAVQVLRQQMTANHLAAPQTCDHDIARPTTSWREHVDGAHPYTRSRWTDKQGTVMHDLLAIDGLGHAWSGGAAGGSYADPRGPSATDAICTFFALTDSNRLD